MGHNIGCFCYVIFVTGKLHSTDTVCYSFFFIFPAKEDMKTTRDFLSLYN